MIIITTEDEYSYEKLYDFIFMFIFLTVNSGLTYLNNFFAIFLLLITFDYI